MISASLFIITLFSVGRPWIFWMDLDLHSRALDLGTRLSWCSSGFSEFLSTSWFIPPNPETDCEFGKPTHSSLCRYFHDTVLTLSGLVCDRRQIPSDSGN